MDKETSGLEVAQAFAEQIRGKSVLITGISPESTGSSTALSVASQDPELLVLASRTQSKLEEVLKAIRDAYPDPHVAIVALDLMLQESVRSAAAEIASLTDHLDVIINNAGVMTQKRQLTREGIEGQFGANHIGHFLLTTLLKPQLLQAAKLNKAGPTRVVNLTSLGHHLSPVRFSNYNLEKSEVPAQETHNPLPPMFAKSAEDGYNGYVAYGQAKTANILSSAGLNERLSKDGVFSYAVHPGSIWTGLSRDLDENGEAAIRNTSPFWKNLDQGCSTTLVAAFDPALHTSMGVLLHDCQVMEPTPYAVDPANVERLWKLSEILVDSARVP